MLTIMMILKIPEALNCSKVKYVKICIKRPLKHLSFLMALLELFDVFMVIVGISFYHFFKIDH